MNKYLIKIAGNRLIKEIMKAPGKFDVKGLTEKGFVRGMDQYAEGLGKGNASLAKQHGTSIKIVDHNSPMQQKVELLQSGGYRFSSGFFGKGVEARNHDTFRSRALSPLHRAFEGDAHNNLTHQMGVRHEVHEARDAKELMPRGMFGGENPNHKNVGYMARDGKLVGNHMSPGVLMRESNDYRHIPHDPKDIFSKFRRESGEANTLHRLSGKEYGKDVFTNKDIRKAQADPGNAKIKVIGQEEVAAHNTQSSDIKKEPRSLMDRALSKLWR